MDTTTVAQTTSTCNTPGFYTALAQVVTRARLALDPACHSRIDKAAALVLAGRVMPTGPHTALVGSQSDPSITYAVNGSCDCPDYERAPLHLCKHKIAMGLYVRTMEALTPAAPPTPPPAPLPEAPCSVNVRLIIEGREVQLTLRGHEEQDVLARLHAVLAQYPLPGRQ